MTAKTYKRTPVNLIAGPLGVGKTTVINHLLKHRPKDEKWAVLVNEYGLVGVDAALMEPSSESGAPVGVDIREVAGGCICCSAAFIFEVSLVQLLRRRPDRLLIEPTGLAAASGILDALRRPGIREAVDVRSFLCLLDPCQFEEASRRDEVQDQIATADILLASRSDLATEEQLDAFHTWANSLRPAKRFVGQIDRGSVDLALLDVVANRDTIASDKEQRTESKPTHHEAHRHDAVTGQREVEFLCDASRPIVQQSHHSPVASTMGWVCWDALVFDADRVSWMLRELAQIPGTRRIKAVLRTNQGWWSFNFADRIEETLTDCRVRKDSRLELVIEGDQAPDADVVQQKLRACLASSSPQWDALSAPDSPGP